MNIFHHAIREAIATPNLQIALDANAERRTRGRLEAFAPIPDYQGRRAHAHAVKADVVAHLDEYVEQFIRRVVSNGFQVHRAADGRQAVAQVIEIAEAERARKGEEHAPILLAKSKSMVSEEIQLNHALEEHNIRAVETDLGEYIVQLRGERPSHILTPAVHLRREQVGQLFHEKLGVPYTEDIPALTAVARRSLRDVFLSADIGLSGVNFGVVETGTLCVVSNEGNARMCTTLPRVHIALMGMERLVPSMEDLALFLSLLPRSATGQKLSVYTSLIRSPRKAAELDGASERHLILLDNGRTSLRHSDLAEVLYCIRCGACLNACPVFREIGGHAYRGADGSIAPYPGPIGSVVSPGLFGLPQYGQLAQASSLCGACREACPVDIDLPKLLLRIRSGSSPASGSRNAREGAALPAPVRLGLTAYRWLARSPRLFRTAEHLGGYLSRLYSPRSAYMHLPAFTGWGFSKDLPRMSTHPFRARWKSIRQEVREGRAGREEASQVEEIPAASGHPPLSARFTHELTSLGGHVYPLEAGELRERLAAFLRERGLTSVICEGGWARDLASLRQLGISLIETPDPNVRCGVTGAAAGVAESGTLVVTSGPDRLLAGSLLPEIHVALLREEDILADLPQVFLRKEVREAASAVLITGPSRTADIEMALTIGVHGPREVHVFLLTKRAGQVE